MHEVLVNRLGGLSLPRKSVVRLTDRPNMTLDVYRGCKTTIQQQQLNPEHLDQHLPTELPRVLDFGPDYQNSVFNIRGLGLSPKFYGSSPEFRGRG